MSVSNEIRKLYKIPLKYISFISSCTLIEAHSPQIEMLNSRKERLEDGCAAISGYSGEVDELNIWLKELEPKLKPFDKLDSADPKDIKNLQGI